MKFNILNFVFFFYHNLNFNIYIYDILEKKKKLNFEKKINIFLF